MPPSNLSWRAIVFVAFCISLGAWLNARPDESGEKAGAAAVPLAHFRASSARASSSGLADARNSNSSALAGAGNSHSLPPGAALYHAGEAPLPAWCTAEALRGSLFRSEELALFASRIAGARRYFEWGAGSSTVLAAAAGVESLTTVDTVPGALECVLAHGAVKKVRELAPVLVDINSDPDNWGHPRDASRAAHFPSVSDMVRSVVVDAVALDVVYVDGRFRGACLLKAASVVSDNCTILVHDWERAEYQRAAAEGGALVLVEVAGRLAALRRGAGAAALSPRDWEVLFAKYEARSTR